MLSEVRPLTTPSSFHLTGYTRPAPASSNCTGRRPAFVAAAS
jgi:hypothetical protein